MMSPQMSTTTGTTLVSATVSTRFTKPVNPGHCSFIVQILKASSYERVLNSQETVLRLHLHSSHMDSNRRLHMIDRSDKVYLSLAVTSISGGRQISRVLPNLLGLGAVLPGDKHVICFARKLYSERSVFCYRE